jgi:Cu-processing system permease protein
LKRADVIFTVAQKEFSDRLRNRWIWTVSALLLISAMTVAFFGAAPVGVSGPQKAGAAMAALMNLTAYLVPLLALIMGAGAIVEDKQRGTLDLILVRPVSPSDFFVGTFLGYCAALFLALLLSLAPIGVVLRVVAGVDPIEYLLLVLLILGLAAAFLSLSFLVALLARDPGRGIASSVLVWVIAVLVFDLALIGVLSMAGGEIPTFVFGALLLLNPLDVFRLLCFDSVGSAAAPLGLSTVSLPLPGGALAVVLLAWIAIPLFISHRVFQKRFVIGD